MVQQAYIAAAAATSEWPQQQPLQVVSNGIHQTIAATATTATATATTLAMPAIVGGQQQSQYSPQDTNENQNYYQQQLIKSAQQQFAVQQQQQQQQQLRMNGISNGHESLYNGVSTARPAPIYAPKPTYYTQQQQQQPLYQQTTTRAFYTPQQQQHSPASQLLQHQQPSQLTATGLSVRQLSGSTMLSQQNSPQSNHAAAAIVANQQQVQSSSSSSEQRNQQMQHLIMSSYQQQQQQQHHQPFNQTQQQTTIMQPPVANYAAYNDQHRQHQEARRSQIVEQHRLIQQQHLRHSARAVAAARLSDRDSVSTVSRFNQFDDRRSFTMRSQYTSANNAAKYSQKFGFLELTCEALKRTLGLTGAGGAGNNKSIGAAAPSIDDGGEQRTKNTTKITFVDSGEDYYFKRKVFKYQLVILRVVSFLCAAFVLLSPVAMLLIPKLESILHNNNQAEFGASSSALDTASSGKQQSTPSATVVTHGVGLSGANKQNQVNYFIPQPQWRISECTSDCDGPLIGFFARFIMLCIAYWAIFFRSQTSSLPRIDFHRCLIISMAVLLTLAYWLFFIFRVFDKRYNDFELQYMTIVQFALSMLESLILLHYLAVVLLELKERKKIYCLKVVRSPDGASQYLSCGSLSIQKCAQFVLEKYHQEFKNFTPYHEHLLELEDELAKNLSSSSVTAAGSRDRGGDKSPLTGRSRANSPATSTHGTVRSGRHHQHPTSRPSRHHSRANSTQHRSPSRSPIRSSRGGRSRSHRKSTAVATAESQPPTIDQQNSSNQQANNSQVKLYQVDLNPPVQDESTEGLKEQPSATNSNNNSNNNNNNNNKDSNADNDSADQSSDATSRMKESSLETIRAANSTSELLNSQQSKSASAKQRSNSRSRHGADQEQSSAAQQQQQQQRDETESVRSVRSRRSTSKSHHRHHHHHRERSSSRANEHHEQTISGSHDDRRRSSNAISIPMNGAEDPLEEHERKLRRRKYRLLMAVQDSFEQIRQIDGAQNGQQQQQVEVSSPQQQQQQQPSPALSPNQAARSLYPSMARSLQKYLRLTKQTGRHNLQSIYEHLSKCLLYRLSPRAFLEKFLNQDPVWQQSETNLFAGCRLQNDSSMLMNAATSSRQDLEINSWSLVCDTLLSRQINSGTFFVLKQGQVSLLVTVAKLPHLNLTEEVMDQKSCKFALTPNSETSV